MSNLRGVIIEKGAVGQSAENLDGVSGFLTNAPAITAAEGITGVELATVYELGSLVDAEAMGITATYDSDNDVLVYRHIKEFYRMAGNGTKLYIMFCDPTKDMETMLNDHGQTLIVGAKGEIRYLMINYNPPTTYDITHVNGLEPVVSAAIPAAQTLADWAFSSDRPLNVFIEGRGIDGLAASMEDLKAMQVDSADVEYNNVSVIIGQDYTYADSLTGDLQNYADVGTFTGTKAGIAVNENPGEVGEDNDPDNLDISSVKKLAWLTAGLSDHSTIISRQDELQTLNDKGYIFAISYTGVAGYRWNDDHVCAPQVIDDDDNMNIHTIALGATVNKLARLIRKYLLPKVKSTVPVDTETGKLSKGMVKYFEGIANKAFLEMAKEGEISGGQPVVDPDSDLISGNKQLTVDFNLVPTTIVGQVKGTINVKKSL